MWGSLGGERKARGTFACMCVFFSALIWEYNEPTLEEEVGELCSGGFMVGWEGNEGKAREYHASRGMKSRRGRDVPCTYMVVCEAELRRSVFRVRK